MKILLDSTSLNHNKGSDGEGEYRLHRISSNITTTDYIDGESFLDLVHTKAYIRKIKKACSMKASVAEALLTPESYKSACNAVGLSIYASQTNNFAIIRPPGHHARVSTASGFCLFNNIAIATQKLVSEGKRVAIIDIDGHHGDGTQRIFFESDKVLFISIHQIGTFPGTGYAYEKGRGAGKGYTINIPLEKGDGDSEFLLAVSQAVAYMKDFCPDIVAISAGFDGYKEDKILDLQYSLDGYNQCGTMLGKNFKNMFAVLEGGYHDNLKECIESFVSGIKLGKGIEKS